MAETTKNIIRFKDDTFPINGNIVYNKNKFDISEWEVTLYYDEKQSDGSVKKIRIEGISSDPTNGQISFFPNVSCYDYTSGSDEAYVAFTVVGTFDYATVKHRSMYYKDANGGYVNINNVYVPYDQTDPAHSDKQRYKKVIEKMTHAVGKLTINDRVGE